MTEKELIGVLKENAEQGLREVLRLYGRAFCTICKNILRDCSPEDQEEALSDILAAVWKSRKLYDEASGVSFKSYCYGIARKTALKKRREVWRAGELIPLKEDMLEGVSGFEEQLQRDEEARILQRVLEDTREPVRTIFILRYFYFYRVKEIAELLQLSEKQVENYLYRGKEALKKELIKRGIGV